MRRYDIYERRDVSDKTRIGEDGTGPDELESGYDKIRERETNKCARALAREGRIRMRTVTMCCTTYIAWSLVLDTPPPTPHAVINLQAILTRSSS